MSRFCLLHYDVLLPEPEKVKAVLDSAAFESETTPHHKCGISVTQMDTIFAPSLNSS